MYGQPYNQSPNLYMGSAPQMQQRLSYLTQQQQAYGQVPPVTNNYFSNGAIILKGRPVTNIEEAKAAQIDLDGTSTFFPCIAVNNNGLLQVQVSAGATITNASISVLKVL